MQNPDFVGTWSFDIFLLPSNFYGLFSMYIAEKHPIDDQKHLIWGYILDRFGYAGFAGEQSPEEIKFTKKYSKAAIERGAASDIVEYHGEYRGIKNNGSYLGEYTVVNGKLGEIPCDWIGLFCLGEHHDNTLVD